jgi:hypothetical protein
MKCGNWKTEHYNSVLETMGVRTVSFLGSHKSEPVGFSTALHLQCDEEGGRVGRNGTRRRVGKKKGGIERR